MDDLTNEQIHAFATDAAAYGNAAAVQLCLDALLGLSGARRRVGQMIEDQRRVDEKRNMDIRCVWVVAAHAVEHKDRRWLTVCCSALTGNPAAFRKALDRFEGLQQGDDSLEAD